MPMQWDLSKLKAKTQHERHRLWLNAKNKAAKSDEAKVLVELIESSGLDYGADKVKSVSLDDAIGKKMHRLIFSAEGRAAALQATENGLPALAGVGPLLKHALATDYGRHNEATIQAGYLVTNLMQQLGFVEIGKGALPPNCIARTGAVFGPAKKSSGVE
jgi:hypothetical protein